MSKGNTRQREDDESGDGTVQFDAADLEYPEESWRGFFREHFGPSMFWALIAIGGSHIVLAPTLGGLYGVFAVWLAAAVFLVKYGGWQLGIRYNYGVGRHPVEGYGDLPGPKNWAQWLTIVAIAVPQTVILGAVGTGAASFAAAAIPGVEMLPLYVVLVGSGVALIVAAEYRTLETVLKSFVVVLGVLVVLGVVLSPPSASTFAETTFAAPDPMSPGFLALFAALAGFAPTGLGTTVNLGSWSIAKEQGARQLREHGLDPEDERYHDYVRAWIATGMRDFNIAYGFTFVLIVAMIFLSASTLYPNPPTDANLAFAIGQLLERSFGSWAFWAMIVGGFAALYSTSLTLLDGASRLIADVYPMASGRDDHDEERLRRGLVVAMGVVSLVPVLAIGSLPVTLVVASAVVVAAIQVFYYAANYVIVRRELPAAFQPGPAARAYYVVTMALVAVLGVLGAAQKLGLVG